MDRVSLPINFWFAACILATAFGSGGCAKTKTAEFSATTEQRAAREHSFVNVLQNIAIDSIVFEHKPDGGAGGDGLLVSPPAPARVKFYGVKQNTKAEIEQGKDTNELKNSNTAKTDEETPGMAETVKAGGEAGKSLLQEIKWILIIVAAILAMALIWKFAPKGKKK